MWSASQMEGHVKSWISLLAFCVLAAVPAQAGPFNWALNFSYNPDATGNGYPVPCCDYVQTQTTPGTAAVSNYAQSGAWGSVSGYASADLASGTLRVASSVNADANGGAYPSMQTNAIFGDGFTTTNPNGTPFTWGSNTATFNLALSGSMSSSDAFAGSQAFVMLFLMKKGTLDPSVSFLDPSTSLGYFVWEFGGNQQLYYTDTNGVSTALTTTNFYSTLPSTIDASFAPGGDFDWAMILGDSGQESPGNQFNIDLSHTLQLTYQAPNGAVTTSDSGVFDSQTAVPEPLTVTLFGAGLAGMGAMRRRRRKG
jgi:hypothetical protein